MNRHPSKTIWHSRAAMAVGVRLVLTLASLRGIAFAQDAPRPSYRIVGYVLGSRGQDLRGIDATKLTHINYAFANVKQGRALLEWPEADGARIAQLQSLRSRNPQLRLLLSIGGGEWSHGFSDAALTEASRETFVASAIDLLRRYAFDGLDIDWEYPAQPGPSSIYRAEDTKNFTRLLQALRAALDEQSRQDRRSADRGYQLSIATNISAGYRAHVELGLIQRFLDHICVMGYDNFGPWTEGTGHHANLYPVDPSLSVLSVAAGVEGHLAAGVPKEKIVLGLAFYGFAFAGTPATRRGLYQPYSGKPTTHSYAELVDQYIDKNGFVRYWDEAAKAPYLWNPESHTVITYDDPESHRYKVEYVKQKGLGGVMYWEHFQDRAETLLNGLYLGLLEP
jgi:chitinase